LPRCRRPRPRGHHGCSSASGGAPQRGGLRASTRPWIRHQREEDRPPQDHHHQARPILWYPPVRGAPHSTGDRHSQLRAPEPSGTLRAPPRGHRRLLDPPPPLPLPEVKIFYPVRFETQ
ncbi:unnamed protein product, partial [Ixodes pacificus]